MERTFGTLKVCTASTSSLRGGLGRLAREDGDGHERVDGAHLAHQGVEYGLVPGVAQAVGPAYEHARAAAGRLALEYLSVERYLLAAGGVNGVLARGLLEERLAQPRAQRGVARQPGNARGEGLVVADVDEIARLAVLMSLGMPPTRVETVGRRCAAPSVIA